MPTFEESLSDIDELMGRVSTWSLPPDGWTEVHTQLALLEDALTRGDVPASRLALSRVEMAGPSLGAPRLNRTAAVDGSTDPDAPPQVVNQTIERIGAIIAEARTSQNEEPRRTETSSGGDH